MIVDLAVIAISALVAFACCELLVRYLDRKTRALQVGMLYIEHDIERLAQDEQA
jgi:hypothetical protein